MIDDRINGTIGGRTPSEWVESDEYIQYTLSTGETRAFREHRERHNGDLVPAFPLELETRDIDTYDFTSNPDIP